VLTSLGQPHAHRDTQGCSAPRTQIWTLSCLLKDVPGHTNSDRCLQPRELTSSVSSPAPPAALALFGFQQLWFLHLPGRVSRGSSAPDILSATYDAWSMAQRAQDAGDWGDAAEVGAECSCLPVGAWPRALQATAIELSHPVYTGKGKALSFRGDCWR
jgi:hypothetical protein